LPKVLIHTPEKLVSNKGKNNQFHVFPPEVRDRAFATSKNKTNSSESGAAGEGRNSVNLALLAVQNTLKNY